MEACARLFVCECMLSACVGAARRGCATRLTDRGRHASLHWCYTGARRTAPDICTVNESATARCVNALVVPQFPSSALFFFLHFGGFEFPVRKRNLKA